jgi:hypothetical protein
LGEEGGCAGEKDKGGRQKGYKRKMPHKLVSHWPPEGGHAFLCEPEGESGERIGGCEKIRRFQKKIFRA